MLGAHVERNGYVYNYRGVVGNERLGLGSYNIYWTKPASKCVVTVSLPTGWPDAVQYFAISKDGYPNGGVRVNIYNFNPTNNEYTSKDAPFDITLLCPAN